MDDFAARRRTTLQHDRMDDRRGPQVDLGGGVATSQWCALPRPPSAILPFPGQLASSLVQIIHQHDFTHHPCSGSQSQVTNSQPDRSPDAGNHFPRLICHNS